MKNIPKDNMTREDMEWLAKELVKRRECLKSFSLYEIEDTPENRILVSEMNDKYGGIFKCR
jgi:hypothetical protein